MEPIQGARLVNALAAFVTITLAAYLAALAVGPVATALLGVALLVTPPFVADHLEVLSEPLFLACTMLALLGMVRAPTKPLAASIAAAAASFVRYAGIAVSGAVIVWAFLQTGALATRLRRAAVAALPTVVLQGAWVLHARAASGKHAIRDFAVYVAGFGSDLRQGWTTLAGWLVPLTDETSVPHPWIAIAVLVVLATVLAAGALRAVAAWRARDPRTLPAARILAATAVLAVCYVGVVVASRLLADPYIPFDDRILSPLIVLIELAAAIAAGVVWSAASGVTRFALLAATVIWGAASFGVTRNAVNWALTHGDDFAGDQWRRSELLDWARTNGRGAPLYSNWPAAVNFYLQRPAWDLPFEDAPLNLRAFADTVRARHALILDFDEQNPEFIGRDTLTRVPGIVVVRRLSDGKVLASR